MIFSSEVYGNIEYEEKNIVEFKKEILGFDNLKRFILVDLQEYEPFKLLQSLEDEHIGLIVTSPFIVYEGYEFELKEDVIKRLEIKDEKEVMVLTTVTLNSNPEKITTNLKAPIIINISNNLGEQIILDKEIYKVKQPLIKE